MKDLILFRHGKSDWDAPYDKDFDRPLAPRGVKAARRLGKFLAQTGRVPRRALVSPSLRTLQTFEVAAEAGQWGVRPTLIPELYEAVEPVGWNLLRREDEEVDAILLVGHEPHLSELLATALGPVSIRFPTAAMARIRFTVNRWSDLVPTSGELRFLVTPKLWGGRTKGRSSEAQGGDESAGSDDDAQEELSDQEWDDEPPRSDVRPAP